MADLMTALRNADAAGDTEAAQRIAAMINANQETSIIDNVGGGLEAAATIVSGAIAEPLAGIAGIAQTLNPFADEGAGAEAVAATRETLTYNPRTKVGRANLAAIGGSEVVQGIESAMKSVETAMGGLGYDVAGPLGGAIATAIPTAILEATGLLAPKMLAKIPGKIAKGEAVKVEALDAELADLSAEPATAAPKTAESIEQAIPAIERGGEAAADFAQFDQSIIKAANDLGFKEIPPSVAAGNAQFRDIAQGMASISGSDAKMQYGQFLESLADKADDIITEGGGEIDKAGLSSRYKDETVRTAEALGIEESAIYDQIRQNITPSETVNIDPLHSFLRNKIDDFGGIDKLPKDLKELARIAYENVDGRVRAVRPTYAAFDLKRREIGQAIGKRSGQFADTESGLLKEMYGAMKEAQRGIVDGAGVGALQDAADAITIKRKAIEDSMVNLLGKDLSKDLMPQMAAKITGLPKGNVAKFESMIEGVPENLREPVVVSALNDLMKGTGADQKGMGAARFVGFMNDLNRSPTAKAALYKYLPKKTQKSVDNLYTLANGVYKANKENITTGKIAQFFPDNRSFVNKMMGGAKAMIVGAAGAKGGRLAAEAADSVADNIAEFMSNQTPRAVEVNKMLSSGEFQTLMRNAVKDGVTQGNKISAKTAKIEKAMERSVKYQNWANGLSGSERARLASLGLVGYLLSPETKGTDK
jgi:hypothetical protein